MISRIYHILPVFLCLLIQIIPVAAQNLAVNPSFEDHSGCPRGLNDLTLNGWTGVGGSGSPDYFNACHTGLGITGVGVPDNFIGWQPARTGSAYTGIITGSANAGLWREYLQSRLLTPLVAGRQYYVSFWVSRAEIERARKADERTNIYRTGQIGAYFSPTRVAANNTILNLQPQVSNNPNRFLDDTLNWQRVDGVFTAAGGEEWIVLGNFALFRDQVYKIVQANPAYTDARNYFFIDDVCVIDLSATGNTAAHDVADCAASSARISGVDTMWSWNWSTGDTAKEITVSRSGTYWVRSFRECGFRTDTFHVYLQPEAPLIRDTVICETDSVTLSVADSSLTRFRWSTGSTDRAIRVTNSGLYRVEAANRYCTYTDSARITVIPMRPSVVLDTVFCGFDPANPPLLSASGESDQYTWSTGVAGRHILVSQPGVYWVRYRDGCPFTDTFRVGMERSDLALPDTFFCAGDTVWIDAGNPRYLSYRWHNGATTPAIAVTTAGEVYVTVQTDACTFSDTARISVKEIGPPALVQEELCAEHIPWFRWPVSGEDLTWYAYPGGGGEKTPPVLSPDSNRYVRYVSQSVGGCESSLSVVTIDIIRCGGCLKMPDAFSPNGDGRNDYFRPAVAANCRIRGYVCTVYNRWGELVYRGEDPRGGWDGTYKGAPANAGTYFFEVRFLYEESYRQEYIKGDFTLVR